MRRASCGTNVESLEPNDSNTPTMVWPYGELPQEIKHDEQPPLEIHNIVLDRVMHSSPAKSDSSSPNLPIRRRRRFDSEPPLALERLHDRAREQDPASPTSPLSDAVDSGTDCWEDMESDIAISLGGILMENNQINDMTSFKSKRISFSDFNNDPKKYIGNPEKY